MRQGLGVNRSAPYEQAAEFSRAVRPAQSQNSIPSGADSERGWKGNTGSVGGSGNTGADRGKVEERRSGFVLRAFSPSAQNASGAFSRSSSAQRSVTPNPEKRSLFQRGIFRKLRKQKSTGDLSIIGGHAVSEFSTPSGCGGGSLFQGRSRRAGGSLRSTFSGSSNLINNTFGRGDKKNIVNGGHGFAEAIEEPVGPNVTETYSGQWNEDRRSGYGIAERSDGLRYAGEWFNNKKDGYGVTYHVNGTKEEGRYKENILIQALNRRSKLFLLRHTKIRDAIEEAVRNAEEAAKKANENSAASAYQRAQTAQMVATAADLKARDARKMSDEARRIARDFSPDFLQPGIEWEKQNPLLKNTLLGQNYTDPSASPKTDERQFQRISNAVPGAGHSLEVSGGSRQGSFRSSFRRSKQANAGDQSSHRPNQPLDGGDYMEEMKHNRELHHPLRHPELETPWLQQTRQAHESYSPPLQRTPAGRPMSRSATTGVTGVAHSLADQRQIAHHMAQHPHSPYLMSSTSQNLDDVEARPNEASGIRPTRARPEFAHSGDVRTQSTQRLTVEKGQLSHTPEHRASEVTVCTAHLMSPSKTYHAQVDSVAEAGGQSLGRTTYRRMAQPPRTARDQLSQHERQTGSYVYNQAVGNNQTEKYNTLQPGFDMTAMEVPHPRRRTLPSIINDPFLTSKTAGAATKVKPTAALQNRMMYDALNEVGVDEDAVHSAENLTAQSESSYIIENGIRKRIRAVQHDQHHRIEDGHQANSDSSQKSFTNGRRPEWTTTYDPYRPGMESTLRMPTGNQRYGQAEQTYEPAELSSLPHTYEIESTLSLWNTTSGRGGAAGSRDKESSAPDIPSACALGGGAGHRYGGYPPGLTHQELEELTSARKLELMEEMKRRKKGEIVIRLADIKDWLRANFVIVFVILVNATLALLFFTLITGSSITSDPGTPAQRRSTPTGQSISPPGQTAIKLAKKVLKSTLKSSKPKALEPDKPS